jgi:uncharacterized membrane protein (DUF106 family)
MDMFFEEWNYLLSTRLIISNVIFILVFLSCFWIIYFDLKKRYKYETGKNKFFNILSNNIKQQQIINKEVVLLLLNSINREFDNSYSLVPILEDYIVYLSKNEDKTSNNDNIKKIHTIKEIIKIENQEKPFYNVPDEEKTILRNINENITNNNLDYIKSNLQELGSVIAARNRSFERMQKVNKWSLPISIFGIILAIIFGIIQLKSIDYNKIEEINSKLIEEISSKLIEEIIQQ